MFVSRQSLATYAGSVAILIVATLLRSMLDPYLGDRAPFIVYIVAVTVTSWRFGAGSGLLALMLGSLLADYFFIEPRFSIGLKNGDRLLGLLLYLITGLIIVLLAESQRRARSKAEQSVREVTDRQTRLQAESAERRRIEREREELLVEQKQLRAVAEEQSATLAGLFEQAPVGIVLFDADLRYVRANSHAVALSGRPIDQLVGRSLREVLAGVVTDSQIAKIERIFRRTLETGEPFSAKGWATDLARPDGEVVHSEWSIRRIERHGGEGFGILKTSIDVTETVHREQALRQSEERFRLAAEAVNGLIYDVDIATGRVERTRGLFELLGYRPEEVPPTFEWWLEQVHPDDLGRLMAKADRRWGESRTSTEYRVRHRDGRYIHVIDRSLSDFDETGRLVRTIGCTQDVTEIRQAELSLREADRRKDEFLAVLAHELRNPLASIRNSLHLMKRLDDQVEPLDLEPERAMAERQVAHLARLIDDLMDVSRISRGRIELRREPTDLVPILGRVIEAVRSPIRERGHNLAIELPDAPVRLEADPTRLEQVFGNLLGNAIKYTKPGGRIELLARVEGDEVAVWVRDTGLGIEPEMLPKVFEMFVQDGHHRGHSQGGLGIGLGLSKTLVEMHGGRISVRSEGPNLGSEFEVRLPVSTVVPPAEPKSNGNGRPAAGRTPRRRVLVVDDNEDAARSLARILSKMYGQEVRVAHDGPSALRVAGEFRPEVVLLDIGLPVMDGCEVARRLRARPEFDETLLIALTGWGQEADRKRTEQAGINRHLVKPVDPDALGDLIAGAVKV